MKLNIIIVLWGIRHGCFFEDVVSKNLNQLIAEIPEDFDVKVKVYCARENLGNFIHLTNAQKIDIKLIKKEILDDTCNCYEKSHYIQNIALNDSVEENAAIFWALPDVILSKGSMRFACKKLLEGFKIVCMSTIRCNFEYYHPETPIYNDSKTLIEFSNKNLHVLFTDMEYSRWHVPKQEFCTTPYAIYKKHETGYFLKAFQGHPFIMKPSKKLVMTSGLDGAVLDETCEEKECYFVKDSDDMFCVDFSPRDTVFPYQAQTLSMSQMIKESLSNCSSFIGKTHYNFFLSTYVVHIGEFNKSSCSAFEKEVNEPIYEILNCHI